MIARIDREAVCDTVAIERLVKLDRVVLQAVAIPHVDPDRGIAAQVTGILVEHGERGVGGPSGGHVGLGVAVLDRQVEIERRGLGIG